MAKKLIPDTITAVFEVGDLVSDQKGRMRVILERLDGEYKFMHLQDEHYNTTSGMMHVNKGSIGTQPFHYFDKYHYLYQP